jgi:hypothetical protein
MLIKTDRSPIFDHVNNIICGLSVIRSACKEKILEKEYFQINDFKTRSEASFLYINIWFAMRLRKLKSQTFFGNR